MTEQTSRLVIEISSEQAKKNAEELSKELVKIFTGGEKASDSTSKLGKTIQVTSNITQNFNTTVNNTTKAVEKQTQELAKQEKQVDKTGLAFKQFASFVAGYVTISTAIGNMDTYTQIGNKLKIVTTNQEQLNRAMEDTFAIAQRSYSSWNAVNDVYSKYMSNAKTLNLTQSEVARLTEITSKAVALSGSSAESAAGALFQYGQSLDGNILRAEEFNSLVDGAGGLLNAIATGLGVTRGQLRQMMLDGKLTGEVITKALLKAGDSVDKLHKKTDVTIKQSLLLLSDSVTKFIGEADHASGASKVTSEAIRTLSENIEPLANGAMALGIGLITKAILAKSIAVRSSIADSIQSRVANMAEAQAQVQLTGVVAIRAKQTTALALTELNLARIEFNGATTATARATAIQRVTAAEIAHSIAVKNSTVASAAYTAAQNAETVATSRLAAAKSLLVGLTGGWVGLAATVAGVSAGYLLMRDNGNEANKTLQNQSRYANLAANELDNLTGAQKRAAQKELSVNLEDQNHKLQVLKKDYELLIESVLDSNKSNKEAYRIWAELKAGVIDVDEAYKRLNNSDFVTSGQINQLTDSKKKIDEQKAAVKNANEQMNLVKTTGANAKQGFSDVTEGAKQSADEVKRLNEKLKDFNKSLLDRKWDTEFKLFAVDKGYTESQAEELLKTYKDAVAKGFKNIPKETGQLLRENWKLDEKLNKTLDARNEKEKDRTKELEKQLKTQQRLIGISGNSGIGTGAHLDVRYGGSRDGQKVSPEHIARLQAGGKSLSSYRVSSDYGQRKAPTAGASSFHKGIDFAMPVGTPITTKVAVKDVKTAYDSKGGGYYSTITFEDGVVLKLLHQSPSMQSKVKGGASTGTYGSYLAQDKAEAKTEKEIETLKANYYSLGEKDEADHIKRVKDLRKNGLHSLIADENTRFEKTKQLRQFEFTMEVDGWRWVGEEKIKNDAYVKKLRVEASTDFNKKEKAEAIKSFEEQRDFELTAYRRLQQDKLNEFKASLEQQTGELQRAYYEVMAQNRMSQQQFAMWQFQNQYGSAVGGAHDFYQNSVKDINKKDDKDQYLIDAETRSQMLIKAEQNLETQLKLIRMKGVEDERVLRQQQYTDNISVYGTMFGQMGELVRGYAGESSGAYKTLLASQKAANLASAIMSGYTAISAAWSSAPFPANLPAVAVATTKTGVLQAAISSISGFSGGGYTGIGGKYDPAGIVHKGEVVFSQDDIKRWGGVGNVEAMRTGGLAGFSGGGFVTGSGKQELNSSFPVLPSFNESRVIDSINKPNTNKDSAPVITINVNIQSDGSSSVDVKGDSNQNLKQFAQFIGTEVEKVIKKECNQGGVIDREFRKRR